MVGHLFYEAFPASAKFIELNFGVYPRTNLTEVGLSILFDAKIFSVSHIQKNPITVINSL